MPNKGHSPVRTCLVCGAKNEKSRLRRMVVDSLTGDIVLDIHQRMHGRGAYVCPECLPRLKFNKRVQKAFKSRAKGLDRHLCRPSTDGEARGADRNDNK